MVPCLTLSLSVTSSAWSLSSVESMAESAVPAPNPTLPTLLLTDSGTHSSSVVSESVLLVQKSLIRILIES